VWYRVSVGQATAGMPQFEDRRDFSRALAAHLEAMARCAISVRGWEASAKAWWQVGIPRTDAGFAAVSQLLGQGGGAFPFQWQERLHMVPVAMCKQPAHPQLRQLHFSHLPTDAVRHGLPEAVLALAGYSPAAPMAARPLTGPTSPDTVLILGYRLGRRPDGGKDASIMVVDVLPPANDPYLARLPPKMVNPWGTYPQYFHTLVVGDPLPRPCAVSGAAASGGTQGRARSPEAAAVGRAGGVGDNNRQPSLDTGRRDGGNDGEHPPMGAGNASPSAVRVPSGGVALSPVPATFGSPLAAGGGPLALVPDAAPVGPAGPCATPAGAHPASPANVTRVVQANDAGRGNGSGGAAQLAQPAPAGASGVCPAAPLPPPSLAARAPQAPGATVSQRLQRQRGGSAAPSAAPVAAISRQRSQQAGASRSQRAAQLGQAVAACGSGGGPGGGTYIDGMWRRDPALPDVAARDARAARRAAERRQRGPDLMQQGMDGDTESLHDDMVLGTPSAPGSHGSGGPRPGPLPPRWLGSQLYRAVYEYAAELHEGPAAAVDAVAHGILEQHGAAWEAEGYGRLQGSTRTLHPTVMTVIAAHVLPGGASYSGAASSDDGGDTGCSQAAGLQPWAPHQPGPHHASIAADSMEQGPLLEDQGQPR
jgi:hypothetical protein